MQKLNEIYQAHGRVFKLVKRDGYRAMYKSSDGVTEVFLIKHLRAANIYGKDYPEREGVPSDEDFGKIAWCYSSNSTLAEARYESLGELNLELNEQLTEQNDE